MADAEQTKVCRQCAETIKVAAKVCPHCCRAQGRLFFISQYDLLAVFSIVVFIALGLFAFRFFCTSRQYSPDRYKITVLSTQFGVEMTSEQTNAVVTGVLTNESDYTWMLNDFEIRFLDASGKTIDVAQAGSDYLNLTALSHSESSFHLDLPRRSIPEYASVKMSITEAKAPGFWFNAD